MQIQVSAYYRVRHPNNYSKMIAARAARDLLSERGAEKRKELLRLFHGDLFLQFIIFFLFLLVYSTNLRFHLLTFRRCSQLVLNTTLADIFSVLLPISKPLTQTHFPTTFLQSSYVVMVAKLKLFISREEVHKKKDRSKNSFTLSDSFTVRAVNLSFIFTF